MAVSKIESWRRQHKDFEVFADKCDHSRLFMEPSSRGMVWSRCYLCGQIIEELPRCTALTSTATRCLVPIAEGSERCSMHHQDESKRTALPVWLAYDK